MGELTRDEIKAEMGRSLPKLELTDNLVDLVFTITSGSHSFICLYDVLIFVCLLSEDLCLHGWCVCTNKLIWLFFVEIIGNAYWCKAMTQFIKDQGAQALFAAVCHSFFRVHSSQCIDCCVLNVLLGCALHRGVCISEFFEIVFSNKFFYFRCITGVRPPISPEPPQTARTGAFWSTHPGSASLIQARLYHRHGIRRESAQSHSSTEVKEHSHFLFGQAGGETVYSMFGSSRSDFLLSKSIDPGDALRAHASQVWECLLSFFWIVSM